MLTLIPVSLAQANEFVRQHHRHHKPVAGHKFSIGCSENGRLCAFAIVGRPVSRYLDDGFTLEVNRLPPSRPLTMRKACMKSVF